MASRGRPTQGFRNWKRSEEEEKAFRFWLKNPVEAVKAWFNVTPSDYQGDVLHGMFNGKDRLALKSAHGTGKTTTLSWAGWVFLNCLQDSRVVATAPTFANLNDQLWPEYAKWHSKMPSQMKDQWSISGNHIRHRANEKVWFAVSRTSNKAANLQGFHGSDIMIQCDEASAVPSDVFEVIEGALSEAGEEHKTAKLILAGNPNFCAGEFYDSFYKNKGLYERFTFSGDPNFLKEIGAEQGQEVKDHGKVYYAPRVTAKYVHNMKVKYGETGAVFDVRVKGVFPRVDDFAVIPLEWAEKAALLPVPEFDKVGDPVDLAVDVARFGGDETVIMRFRRGIPVSGPIAKAKTSTVEVLHMIQEERARILIEGLSNGVVIIDEPGVGGGVIDFARNAGIPVRAYNGGQSLKDGIDPPDEIRQFANKRARTGGFTNSKR
jgi:phage terminase large subunit